MANSTETPNVNVENVTEILPPAEPTRLQEFSKTGTAAKLSGKYNETAGFFKRKIGEFSDDPLLQESGRNQQLLGKVHRLVGSLRDAREAGIKKVTTTLSESQAICRKHGGRVLDVASDFVDDMKKTLLK